jgi:AcrR family transcriptional regulator
MNRHVATPDPSVSPTEQRAADPRVQEILVQARQAFVEKGFDGASMQDLARAAGMSAGNFYRYFPSKAAIVEALVNRDLDEVEREFTEVLGSPRPIAALREVIGRRLTEDCENDLPLWAEITAAAGRKPEIAKACARMEEDIARKIIAVLSVGCGIDVAEGAIRFETPARFILLLVRGAAMQNAANQTTDKALNSLILNTIHRLIDEITIVSPKVVA